MSFGLASWDSAGDPSWNTDQVLKPCIDIITFVIGDSTTYSYPQYTGATISVQQAPTSATITITYPDGVPTISLSFAEIDWYLTLWVFVESWPSALETQFSYRILNANGTNAITPDLLALPMEFVESVSTSAGSLNADVCDLVASETPGSPAYVATVSQTDYPEPPFVMIDLPEYPYFGGILDYQDWPSPGNWTIRIAGVFASAPTLYLFRRRTTPITEPVTGMGINFYDEGGDCIANAGEDILLGFTGEAETPPIDNFDVPANNTYTFTIGNQDQTWTPDAPLPTNALLWVPAKQISCAEGCLYDPKKPFEAGRLIREWHSGICRYNSTDLMMRLNLILSRTWSGASGYSADTFYYHDIAGGAYTGTYLIADKDMVIP